MLVLKCCLKQIAIRKYYHELELHIQKETVQMLMQQKADVFKGKFIPKKSKYVLFYLLSCSRPDENYF